MTSRKILFFGLSVCLLSLWYRSPRLDPEMVSVTESRRTDYGIEIEYRTTKPFSLTLVHVLQVPIPVPDEAQMDVIRPIALREPERLTFWSNKDLLRGEHYIRLRTLRSTESLILFVNEYRCDITPWSSRKNDRIQYRLPAVGVRVFDGNGHAPFVYFRSDPVQEEFVFPYVGSDLQGIPAKE